MLINVIEINGDHTLFGIQLEIQSKDESRLHSNT